MQRLYEYSFYDNGIDEAGETDNQQPQNNTGGDPNAMGGNQNAMGGDPNAMGGDPNAMGGDSNAIGGQPTPEEAMGDDNGFDMGGDMGAQPGPDDNVIDITDLTDSQEDMKQGQEECNSKLDDINSKFDTLMKVIDKFNKALDANDEKIGELKREIAKRNPTEEETMNVRLNAGGNPFDQKPEEFWRKFDDINNHYNITTHNKAPQYQIRKYDIDNYNDKLIDSSFDKSLNEANMTLKDYFTK